MLGVGGDWVQPNGLPVPVVANRLQQIEDEVVASLSKGQVDCRLVGVMTDRLAFSWSRLYHATIGVVADGRCHALLGVGAHGPGPAAPTPR